RILLFQSPPALCVGHLHPSMLRLPVIQGRCAHPVLAGQIGRLRTRLVLAQNPDNLLFRKPLPLHLSVLQSRPDSNSRWRKNSVAGHYDAVRRYAAAWSKTETEASAAAYVPLSFDPGEAYQFDWSHEIVLVDGVATTVKVAHVRLCHSRMPFVRAYPRETQEMVFDAHDEASAFFGGACARGIYDNMKTA